MELSRSIRKLSEDEHNLHYTARVKGKEHHFKAGNLNHGLKYVQSLPGGPAEYVAALDADMIPDPQWLRALLPHMLRNPNLALAQPPQRFYDVASNDPLLQGLDVNFKITEPLKETMGSTWCGGSGYVLRRTALDSIGGFPTESVGEDMYCSNLLIGKGWDAVYIDETLQTGRVPESYKAHVKQQSRWTAIAMRFYVYGENSRKMNLRQRLTGLFYVILSLGNILTTFGMVTLLLSIASGRPLVVYKHKQDFRTLVQLVCALTISEWLDDYFVGLITGYGIAISEGHINYWIAPCKKVLLPSKSCLVQFCLLHAPGPARLSALAPSLMARPPQFVPCANLLCVHPTLNPEQGAATQKRPSASGMLSERSAGDWRE
ncbi:MAG: hypothetical protein Q9213_002308 [Squamulea squamosa]